MTPQSFIELLAPAAQEIQRTTGIPASFTIGQAAVESAWFNSGLAQKAFNLFGIKAQPGDGWSGDTITMPTREVVDKKSVMIQAEFRKYASLEDGLADHAKFLTENERYKPAFQHKDDSYEFAEAVAAAGYASDPNYAQTIISIINQHKLKQYDTPSTT